jgi:hypothetical protein
MTVVSAQCAAGCRYGSTICAGPEYFCQLARDESLHRSIWAHRQVPMHEINLATGHHPLDMDIVTGYLHTIQDLGERLEPIELEYWISTDQDTGVFRRGYTLTDGRHRFVAHLIAGLPTIWSRIKP